MKKISLNLTMNIGNKPIYYFLLLLMALGFSSSSMARDANWYSMHPEVVQKVIKDCPRKQPKDISCKQLQEIGANLNDLITLFVTDSHNYGQQILDLQQHISSKTKISQLKPEDEDLKLAILNDKLDVNKRLNVVRWLASPK